jgi:hypothetical protein
VRSDEQRIGTAPVRQIRTLGQYGFGRDQDLRIKHLLRLRGRSKHEHRSDQVNWNSQYPQSPRSGAAITLVARQYVAL